MYKFMANQNKTSKQEKIQPITKIEVMGFKALAAPDSVEIRPLTLLAGANSSGKSSLMQPLLMMKQTLQATYDPGELLLDGPNIRFSSIDQMYSRIPGFLETDIFSVEIEVEKQSSLKLTFQKKPKFGLKIAEMIYRSGDRVFLIRPEMSSEEIKSVVMANNEEIEKTIAKIFSIPLDWSIEQERCFLSVVLVGLLGNRASTKLTVSVFPIPTFDRCIRQVIHVPGLRGNPERKYKTTSIGPDFPGTFENYVASIVHHWQITKDFRLQNLGQALRTLGLTWKVEARQVDETQVELLVGRLTQSQRGKAHDTVSIADVGFGVSQVLPVVVALLAAEEGQLVYLEQPEIHLHPRAQVAMAQVIANAAQRGVRVVVETHSSLLLRGVQTLVAKGQLSPELVKLHWFTRNPKNGATEIRSADLDENGAFGDWPEDFDDVALDTERDYLDAVEVRAFKQ